MTLVVVTLVMTLVVVTLVMTGGCYISHDFGGCYISLQVTESQYPVIDSCRKAVDMRHELMAPRWVLRKSE